MVLVEIVDAGGVDFGDPPTGREDVFHVLPGHVIPGGLFDSGGQRVGPARKFRPDPGLWGEAAIL